MTDDTRQPAPPEAAAPDAVPTVAGLEARLAAMALELEAARKEAAEATLRAQAEVQNLRRRLERDADNARKYALEKFAAALLPVADSLERGLAAVTGEDDTAKASREGISLTLKLLVDTLRRFEVEEIDPKGQPFNPQFHEAVAQVPHPDAAPNTVIEVMQKGFQLSGRLLRPAMVVVARAP
ncbi:MAG: nucleotide exchange factor GrpE [Pseudomonadota bacterium]